MEYTTGKILALNLLSTMYIQRMIGKLSVCGIICLFSIAIHAQEADVQKDFEKAKAEMKQNSSDELPDYIKAGSLLERVVEKDPGNAEAWYFYGYAIDRYNSSEGETMIQVQLPLTIKASEAFEKCLQLSKDKYTGDLLLLDPHTKIFTVWGTQAWYYIYQNKRDSAVWCMQQADQRGGVNRVTLNYFRQVMNECSKGAYLFTSGDMYFYYTLFLQLTERYRNDLNCIDLNLLNVTWYPDWLQKKNIMSFTWTLEKLKNIDLLRWDKQPVTIYNENKTYPDTAITWVLKPTLDNKFLIRSNRLLLDFLKLNAFEKPVFFAGDVPQDMNLYLDAFLQSKGLTYKLATDTGNYNLNQLVERLKKLSTISTDTKTYLNNRDNIQVLNNYRFAYTTAAIIAAGNGNRELAVSLLETAERKYPEQVLPFFADATKQWFVQLKQKIIHGEKID